MTTDIITLEKINDVYFKVYLTLEQSVELNDFFSYYTPGYKFNPNFKKHLWDGKIRFYHSSDQTLPIGLYQEFITFCKKFKYEYQIIADIDDLRNNISDDKFKEFITTLFKDTNFIPRDYQEESIKKALINKRGIIELATASGKSLLIYSIIRFIFATEENAKILLIVPNINLVNQMFNDFKEYGFKDAQSYTATVYSGSRNYKLNKPIIISTWQSLINKPSSFFEDFNAVICDECHLASANSIKKILKNCNNASYRYGFTGTMPVDKSEFLTIVGFIGPEIYYMKYSELMDKGVLAKIKVVNIFLKYPQDIIKQIKYEQYEEELRILYDYPKRNNILKYIIDHLNPTENILVLCHKIDHLKKIKKYLEDLYVPKGYTVYETYGETTADDRENIRQTMNKQEQVILVGTYSTIGTGYNVRRIHHIILASSYRSKIRVLQSIGRGLRLHETKDKLMVWDIIDDVRWTTRFGNICKNYMYKHFEDRLKYYTEHGFNYINHNVVLENL